MSSEFAPKSNHEENKENSNMIEIQNDIVNPIVKSSAYCIFTGLICFCYTLSSITSAYLWQIKMDHDEASYIHNPNYTWTFAELPRVFGFCISIFCLMEMALHILDKLEKKFSINHDYASI